MRQRFTEAITSLMESDNKLVLLLGDIGAWQFRFAAKEYRRVYNLGVCEQAMIGVAAGLALEGFAPVVHSIAPFVTERVYEQIKIDIVHQNLPVKIVSVGASYDYAASGYTHFCPADVAIMCALPGMTVVVPGTPAEFESLFQDAHRLNTMAYFRLSKQCNRSSWNGYLGRGKVVVKNGGATVLAVGPTLDLVMEAVRGLDVTVLYYTTIAPFDEATLRQNCSGDCVILVEPYNAGVLVPSIQAALDRPVKIESIGVSGRLLGYGTPEDHNRAVGLTAENVRKVIERNL